jgi:DNA-binding CsgD family transcriptional regulator
VLGTLRADQVFYLCAPFALTRAEERRSMAQCITCGSELHPDRAKKYDYCMAPECQRKNLKDQTMVAIGVNKSAEYYMLLDEQTRDDLARGKFRDQRRGYFGTSVPSSDQDAADAGPAVPAARAAGTVRAQPARRHLDPPRPAARQAPRTPWTKSQERLALLYNEQGKRPDEIAQKLGLSTYTVTQIILGSRNRGKL